jgi:acyl-coenzyme A thioesterase PaaI-like protein
MEWAGARLAQAAGGTSQLLLAVSPPHRGGAGTDAVNGAILAFSHDIAQGAAIRSLLDEKIGLTTISMHVEYLVPLRAEQRVKFDGKCVRLGSTIAFGESTAMDDHGRACSRAVGTFKILKTRGA